MKFSPRFAAAGALAVGLITVSTAVAVQASPPLPSPTSAEATQALVAATVANYIASRPGAVHPSADDVFVQHPVISSGGMQYVPYDRTYQGLRVVGGDFVAVTDGAGQVRYTSVAQPAPRT